MLDLDAALRRQHVAAAVEMGAELHALLADLAQLRQAHDLEAAGIREDRARPVHEFVQAAQRRHPLGAGPQHEMIGIAQQDLGPRGGDGFRQHGLDRARRAHGHEGRRLHRAMGGMDPPAARLAVPRQELEAGIAHAARSSSEASP